MLQRIWFYLILSIHKAVRTTHIVRPRWTDEKVCFWTELQRANCVIRRRLNFDIFHGIVGGSKTEGICCGRSGSECPKSRCGTERFVCCGEHLFYKLPVLNTSKIWLETAYFHGHGWHATAFNQRWRTTVLIHDVATGYMGKAADCVPAVHNRSCYLS